MAKRKQRKPRAKRADKYDLYQRSVQDADADVLLIQRIYKKQFGTPARMLREDFCGTALLACSWVQAHKENRALGVDLDPKPLSWGKAHNVSELDVEEVQRLQLVRRNVLDRTQDRADVLCAFNFSYFIFKERQLLLDYFKTARSHLKRDGLLLLDAYGGADAQRCQEELRELDGFDYIWDQDRYDPISNDVVNHIHFLFSDGSKLKRAFTYQWRLWSLPELRDLLYEAGFSDVTVYWEGTEARTNEPNGVFSARKSAPDDPAWIAYISALR